MIENIKFKGADNTFLPGTVWMPESAPGMVLQISHGMTEHIGRYKKLSVVYWDCTGCFYEKEEGKCAQSEEELWNSRWKNGQMTRKV